MAQQKRTPQQVRIIGGMWKGRKLRFDGDATLRPTLGRVRETLFNWLRPHIHGMRVLDGFAGSGVLGFEALSQGAAEAVFVESNARTLRSLQDTVAELKAGTRACVVKSDLKAFLRRNHAPFDLIFLDPPFDRPELLGETLGLLCDRGLVGGYVYAEARRAEDLERAAAASGLQVIRRTRAGDAAGALLMLQQETTAG